MKNEVMNLGLVCRHRVITLTKAGQCLQWGGWPKNPIKISNNAQSTPRWGLSRYPTPYHGVNMSQYLLVSMWHVFLKIYEIVIHVFWAIGQLKLLPWWLHNQASQVSKWPSFTPSNLSMCLLSHLLTLLTCEIGQLKFSFGRTENENQK